MPGIARAGDSISHGGNISSGSPDTLINNIPIARVGDSVNCSEHGNQIIVGGSPSSTCNNIPIARVGDSISCGALITSGSPDSTID